MASVKKMNEHDIAYYERKGVIDAYLQIQIKKDFYLGIDYCFFKFSGEWLDDPAVIDEESEVYVIKTDELIKFASSRGYEVIYIKDGIGITLNIDEADGIMLKIA